MMNKFKKIVSILILTIFVLAMFGCGANPRQHSTKFSKASGEWTLDSYYIDGHSQKFRETTKIDMNLDDSNMKLTITYKKGNKTEEKSATVSNVSDGSFTVNGDEGTQNYTFNYDPGPEMLHLYYKNDKGETIHYVYKAYTKDIPWKTTDKTTKEN